MLRAQDARKMVEDQSILTQADVDVIEEKTLDAISKGRMKAAMSFSTRDDREYRKLYPLKRYLEIEGGYRTTISSYSTSDVLNWMW